MRKYKAIYRDKFGTEHSEFRSDGSELIIKLRGIEFYGESFETLEGEVDDSKFEYKKYADNSGDLTNCEFDVEIPIKINEEGKLSEGLIKASIKIEEIFQKEKIDELGVQLTLSSKYGKFSNPKRYDGFESALNNIQDQLPDKIEMQICLSCKYSNYISSGEGMFGGIRCFKGFGERVSEIVDKLSLFEFRSKGLVEGKMFDTQETYDCDKHQFMKEGDWTRKDWKIKNSPK